MKGVKNKVERRYVLIDFYYTILDRFGLVDNNKLLISHRMYGCTITSFFNRLYK